MSEETNPVEAAFIVVVNTDGTFLTIPVSPDSQVLPNKVNRLAGTFDVYNACREISSDIESTLLAQKIASNMVALLKPEDSEMEMKRRMAEKLKERS